MSTGGFTCFPIGDSWVGAGGQRDAKARLLAGGNVMHMPGYSGCGPHAVPLRLESVRTRTDPSFEFVYDSLDLDMERMKRSGIVEPMLTHTWHELTWECCRKPGSLVIDIGANFGWYTLLSLSLGCSVVAFEPLPVHLSTLTKGLAANVGFTERTEIHRHVVMNEAGNFTLRVPVGSGRNTRPTKSLGMAGITDGALGAVKAYPTSWVHYNVSASSVRVDDVLAAGTGDVCMLKADVEGYEADALATARRLLRSGRVHAVQMEVTKMPQVKGKMVDFFAFLERGGFKMRQVPNSMVDDNTSLPRASWRNAPGPWAALPRFPSRKIFSKHANHTRKHTTDTLMDLAWRYDLLDLTSNIVGRLENIRIRSDSF